MYPDHDFEKTRRRIFGLVVDILCHLVCLSSQFSAGLWPDSCFLVPCVLIAVVAVCSINDFQFPDLENLIMGLEVTHPKKFAHGILSAPVIDAMPVSPGFHFTLPGEQHCLACIHRTRLANSMQMGKLSNRLYYAEEHSRKRVCQSMTNSSE